VPNQLKEMLKSEGTRAKAQRSSALVIFGFGTSNLLRLVSNLILTRLLFPEAFGLMALVFVFLTGLKLFSDVGFNLSIVQNKRGEDPTFLNTIWSLQIIRGIILFLASCALGYPAVLIYDEPLLAQLLPAMGLTAFISGFTTTKVALANRYLQVGVLTFTDIASQIVSLTITVILAWMTESVWSLVIGAILGTFVKVIAQHVMLKGPKNYWYIERAAAWEALHFGKYIFLSSIAGFLIIQSDRAILGAYVSLAELGIFTVGFIFASLPLELNRAIGSKVIFPLFSKFPTKDSAENRSKVLRARQLTLFAFAVVSAVLSVASVPMIDLLYDSRYHDAGAILALMGFTAGAYLAQSNYNGAFLAAGDSLQQFRLTSIEAIIQVTMAMLLISQFGTLGAVFAFGTTMLIAYPFRARVAWKYNVWDPKTDFIALGIAWSGAALALYLWWEDISVFALAHLH
jgi:O-antigen/teichoic acid export membrane protein